MSDSELRAKYTFAHFSLGESGPGVMIFMSYTFADEGTGVQERLSNLPQIRQPEFLVAQWVRICRPMQGDTGSIPARENPTCRGAYKPVYHNY